MLFSRSVWVGLARGGCREKESRFARGCCSRLCLLSSESGFLVGSLESNSPRNVFGERWKRSIQSSGTAFMALWGSLSSFRLTRLWRGFFLEKFRCPICPRPSPRVSGGMGMEMPCLERRSCECGGWTGLRAAARLQPSIIREDEWMKESDSGRVPSNASVSQILQRENKSRSPEEKRRTGGKVVPGNCSSSELNQASSSPSHPSSNASGNLQSPTVIRSKPQDNVIPCLEGERS